MCPIRDTDIMFVRTIGYPDKADRVCSETCTSQYSNGSKIFPQ